MKFPRVCAFPEGDSGQKYQVVLRWWLGYVFQVLRRNGGPYGEDRGARSAEARRRPAAFRACIGVGNIGPRKRPAWLDARLAAGCWLVCWENSDFPLRQVPRWPVTPD